MPFIRSTWARLTAFLGRRSTAVAVAIGLVAVPLWAITCGLLGVLHEIVGRGDDLRVRRKPGRTPAPAKVRWGAAASAWVLSIALLGSPPSTQPVDGQEAAIGTESPAAPSPRASSAPVEAPTPGPLSTAAPTPPPSIEPSPAASGPTGRTEIATVVRVIDGDTIVVEIDGVEHRVRYIGIDTPEPDDSDPAVRAMAIRSSEANAALVEGGEVLLEQDVSETDQFDRLLRTVWVRAGDGRLVNVGVELVRQGYAQVSTYPPDVKYVDLLLEAQESARTREAGLWAPAPTATPAPTPEIAVIDTLVSAGLGDGRAQLRGAVGSYTWTSVTFPEAFAVLRWTITPDAADCRVDWSVEPASGDGAAGSVDASSGGQTKGSTSFETTYFDAALKVDSTCPKFQMSLEGEPPPPTPAPTRAGGGGGGQSCHPSYEGACLRPDVADYDCAGGSGNGPLYVEGPVYVVGWDEYGLDGNDNDGIGCE